MSLDFTAVDVETANRYNRGSICQLGLAMVRGGEIVQMLTQLIDPKDDFDEYFTAQIHGIDARKVAGRPTFQQWYPQVAGRLSGVVVAHNAGFDRSAIAAACRAGGLPPPQGVWLDSLAVARQAWPQLSSHSLSAVARHLSIQFRHHDAAEDARAAAEIVLRACAQQRTDVNGWLRRLGLAAPRTRH